ncbi:neutral zinc metallopeptidase [Nocardia sp. NPDC048505]|uniref:neutral zinc metallopeptidase n=1 Tax=Nocardia sp. NPDC048505 TaxID=3155756 RepID=UPI0033DDF4FB
MNNDPDLGYNPVLTREGAGISAVNCRLPAWSADQAAAEAFYRAAIECHNDSWRPALAAFGITLTPPSLWSGARGADYTGACGANATGREAFYCPANREIVMPYDTMKPITGYGVGYALAVLSHEYGHHLQQITGIMPAFQARVAALDYADPAVDLLNRRLELQAWCFSGMFYGTNTGRGSITPDLTEQADDNNGGAGDRPGERRFHGTSENVTNWFSWGQHPSLDQNAAVEPSMYECNPWAARDAGWLE